MFTMKAVHILEKAQELYGWTMCSVLVRRMAYKIVTSQTGVILIVDIRKMCQFSVVRISVTVMSPNIALPLTLRTSPSDYASFNQKKKFFSYLVLGCFWKEKNSKRFSL